MQTILVTGSNGQLGNEIKKFQDSFNYIFTDIDELDITNFNDLLQLFNKNKIDAILNCAAYTAVDKAETEPELAHKINVKGVENLNKISMEKEVPIIHISTDYVFDGKNFKPYLEQDKTNPQGIYGKTKLEGEEKLSKNPKAVIIRTSWLYSSYGNNFVKTIIKIAKENREIKVVSDQIGSPTYAFDLAEGCINIMKKIFNNTSNYSGIYHFSNEGVCSWYDFAKFIVDYKKIECIVFPISTKEFPRPAQRPHFSVLDKTKIKTTFDIKIPYWTDSLKNCLNLL